MKKMVAIFFLSLMVLSVSAQLIDHVLEETQQVCKAHSDEDCCTSCCSPFHICNCHSFTFSTLTIEWLKIISFGKTTICYCEPFYNSFFLCDIWQPPKTI